MELMATRGLQWFLIALGICVAGIMIIVLWEHVFEPMMDKVIEWINRNRPRFP